VPSKTEHNDLQTRHDLEGRHANYFKVGYNAFEFVLDFGQYFANEDEEAKFHTRIITSPGYAKSLLEILQERVDKYELDFGIIVDDTTITKVQTDSES
jgi:hypothetical protein